jgi:5-methylthioadenosine/S-adenosylhomocysteine deaminase
MSDMLIHNCHALVPSETDGLTVQLNQDILVEGNKIAAIMPTCPEAAGKARVVLDARQMLAIPGLINTHAHVPMVIFRGLAEDVPIARWFNEFMWPLESNLTAEDVYWGMLLGLVEMIESGVTMVADHYFYMDYAARAVEEAGSRAALGWAVFADRGYAALNETAAFAERWQGQAGGRITTWMAPHAPYTCDDDFLKAAVAHARRLNIGIHIHAAEEIGQTRASLEKRGITPIQVLQETGILEGQTLIAHGCGILPEDITLLANYAGQVGIAHAPKTYLKLGMGLTPIAQLRAAGVAVGLATDGAVSNNTLDIFESLRLMAMLQKHEARDPEAMPIPEALDIATRGSAAAVGMGNLLGQLSPGHLADIVLLDSNGSHLQPLHSITASLVYSVRASDVQTVIVDGKVIMQDRQLITLDKRRIIAKVKQNMKRLAQRVPEKRIQVYNP